MPQTGRPSKPTVSPCFRPEDEENLDLHVNLTDADSRGLEFLQAGNGHPCFRPEDEENLDLHVNLTGTDSRELELLQAGAATGGSVVQ